MLRYTFQKNHCVVLEFHMPTMPKSLPCERKLKYRSCRNNGWRHHIHFQSTTGPSELCLYPELSPGDHEQNRCQQPTSYHWWAQSTRSNDWSGMSRTQVSTHHSRATNSVAVHQCITLGFYLLSIFVVRCWNWYLCFGVRTLCTYLGEVIFDVYRKTPHNISRAVVSLAWMLNQCSL